MGSSNRTSASNSLHPSSQMTSMRYRTTPEDWLRSSTTRVVVASTTHAPKSKRSGTIAIAPEVPSATIDTVTRSVFASDGEWSSIALAGVPTRGVGAALAAPPSYEWGTRNTSGTLAPMRFTRLGMNVQVLLIVSPPRIIPAGGVTRSVLWSFGGIAHSYRTLIRDTLVTSTSRAVTAPTHVGLKTNESSLPTRSFGTWPCARTSSSRQNVLDPFRAHTRSSRWGSQSEASKRNVMSANDFGPTTPLVGDAANRLSAKSAASGDPTRFEGNSNPTLTSPSFTSAKVWYERSPLTVGGNKRRFPRAVNRHRGMNPIVAPRCPNVCPSARTLAVHGGVKFSSVTWRKLRIALTYAKHSSWRV